MSGEKSSEENYDESYRGYESYLMENGFTLEIANNYKKSLYPQLSFHLFVFGIPYSYVNKLPDRFNSDPSGIYYLYKNEVPPEITISYPSEYDGHTIAELFHSGITPDKLPKKANFDFLALISRSVFSEETRDKSIKLLGLGKEGIVWLDDGKKQALKFTSNADYEYKLSLQISNYTNSLKNVIKIIEKSSEECLVMEYVSGDSLENILKKKGSEDSEKVLKYSADILNGLMEMRNAGIYFHRDIRPANIMIDSDKDIAVIIDLGIAITDPYAETKDNRRYGSGDFLANDLISLGQVTYRMAAGEHIFLEAKNMSETIYADSIHDNRLKIYSDEDLLRKHLDKVDETVSDKNIAELIKALLTAKPNDHEKIMKMFY